jgi:hypothetical protein
MGQKCLAQETEVTTMQHSLDSACSDVRQFYSSQFQSFMEEVDISMILSSVGFNKQQPNTLNFGNIFKRESAVLFISNVENKICEMLVFYWSVGQVWESEFAIVLYFTIPQLNSLPEDLSLLSPARILHELLNTILKLPKDKLDEFVHQNLFGQSNTLLIIEGNEKPNNNVVELIEKLFEVQQCSVLFSTSHLRKKFSGIRKYFHGEHYPFVPSSVLLQAVTDSNLERIKWIHKVDRSAFTTPIVSLTTVFHKAVELGKYEELELISHLEPSGLELTTYNNLTPAHQAAALGRLDMIKMIYQVNTCLILDEFGFLSDINIAHLATQNGHLEILKWIYQVVPVLLSKCDSRGHFVTHLAAQTRNMEIIEWLYEVLPELFNERTLLDGKTTSHFAAYKHTLNNQDLLFWICRRIPQQLPVCDSRGNCVVDIVSPTVLIELLKIIQDRETINELYLAAAEKGVFCSAEILPLLDRNIVLHSCAGSTLIHFLRYAADCGSISMFQWIYDGDKEAFRRTNRAGTTIIHTCIDQCWVEGLDWLYRADPEFFKLPCNENIILHPSLFAEVVRWILCNCVNLAHYTDEDNRNIAHHAADDGMMEILQDIHMYAPELFLCRTASGDTVGTIAAKKSYKKVLVWLSKNQPESFRLTTTKSQTVAHIAAENSYQCFSWILKHFPEMLQCLDDDNSNVAHVIAYQNVEFPHSHGLKAIGNSCPQLFSQLNSLDGNVAHIAAKLGNVNAVKWIAQNFPEVFAMANLQGNTVAHYAVKWPFCPDVRWVYATKKGLFSQRNNDGLLPYHLSRDNTNNTLKKWVASITDKSLMSISKTKKAVHLGN